MNQQAGVSGREEPEAPGPAERMRQATGDLLRLCGDAAQSFVQRPMHTLAMIAGITLGVASAAATVVIADTQQAQIDLRFDLQRSRHVVIQAEGLPKRGFPAGQVARIAGLEPVGEAGELSIWENRVRVSRSVPDQVMSATIVVADRGGLAAAGAVVQAGAPAGLISGTEGAPVAWVGDGVAAMLGVVPARGPAAGGDAQVLVNGTPLSVAGVLRSPGAFGYLSSAVVVSRATAVGHFASGPENVRLVAGVRPGSAGAVGEHAVRALDLDGSATMTDVTAPDGEILQSNVAADLRRIGIALASVIGIVGMLTVANTLVMSVYQRRRELGLRSAMGWTRRRIASLLLLESGLAGLVAGLLGAGAGVAGAAVWCRTQGWDLVLDPRLPLVVVAGGVAASLVGGLLPALKAASISPLVAMRS